MQSKHTRTLQAGFGLSLFILIASSIASFVSIRTLINNSSLVRHTNTVLQELENVISFGKDAETGQRGFLLSWDPVFLDPYKGARTKTFNSLAHVKELTQDNPAQQRAVERLKSVLNNRFVIMDRSIAAKLVDVDELRQGKETMDSARAMVISMQSLEKELLDRRTESLNRFASITPIIIIFAALAALLITVYFYRKVSNSFRDNLILTEELKKNELETSSRIDIIQNIAANISRGDYKVRLNDQDTDGLGILSGSLNKMAASLEHSFTLLSNKEWLQSGLAQLSDKMAGEKDIPTLTHTVIEHMALYSGSQVGAFYILENDSSLVLKSGYAYKLNTRNETVFIGEGIVGQSALSKKEIIVNDIPESDFFISFGAGNVKPKNIIAFPVLFEDNVRGVIELGAVQEYSPLVIEFMNSVSESIGIAVNTAVNRAKLQELLEETQAQSEELQAQHSELENLNTELEAQAEKLQASEEELKVQQEELTETNHELNERSKLLEEKNELVLTRNSEIQKKSEELALNAKYKSEFLANMSHELRTPLNSILLLSRLLGENSDKNLKKEQVEFANVIQSSGNSLLLLIDDILDLSKIESGKMELEYEFISIQEIARDMQMIFEALAKEKKIAFAVKLQEGLPANIETDKMRLEQIIKNLASNAIKFTNTGEVSIVFGQSDRKDFLDISVTDTGIGIPSEKQELIFEAFQQADGSTRRKYGGTGLGLSISRQLALLLKGDITLQSAPGQGSTFTFSVPVNKNVADEVSIIPPGTVSLFEEEVIKKTPAKKDVHVYIAEQIPAEIPDDRDNIDISDKVMLIIEDDTAFAHALLDFTRKKGYKGVVAVRGDHGLELARKYLPTGILLDIQLPVKSGWEVMDELKSDKATKHIPVHIMSSFEAKKQSLLSGAIDFINKPMAFEQMDTIFQKIEFYLKKDSKKVLIIEDNSKHAEALSYFLSTHQINSVISSNIENGLSSLQTKEVDCVILDMGVPDTKAYEALESMKLNKGLEDIPVIIFTGKSMSRTEEMHIRKYADSIVVKTAHSYRRILDEVSLFLHLVEENKKATSNNVKSKPLSEILKNKTVLVADDDVRNIFSLTRALEQHQMQVIPAIDGKEALQLLDKKEEVDIVLMDMMMPEMDGYETIANIRKQARWKNLPVIAVTAKAMTGDREKCIQAGASDYISKPVDLDQLISLLRIWLYDTTAKKNI